MMFRLVAVLALTCAVPRVAAQVMSCTKEEVDRWNSSGYPKKLDVGLYWLDRGKVAEKAAPGGHASRFYNPEAPTVIYVHGWTGWGKGNVPLCNRLDMYCDQCKDPYYLQDPLLDAGWNVGFFHWDQLGDEPCERDAEEKIWFDHRGKDHLRWKSYDPETKIISWQPFPTETPLGAPLSVADICAWNIESAMANYAGPHVRMVGHSMGTQLVLRCAEMLHQRKVAAAPQRIALLDPFFSSLYYRMETPECHGRLRKTRHGDYNIKMSARVAETLWEVHGVTTEMYKSSPLSENSAKVVLLSDPNHALESVSAYVSYDVQFCPKGHFQDTLYFLYLMCKHHAMNALYFRALLLPPPPLSSGAEYASGVVKNECATPSPSCSDAAMRDIITQQHKSGKMHWVQERGAHTSDPSDDAFGLYPRVAIGNGSVPLHSGEMHAASEPREYVDRLALFAVVVALFAVVLFAAAAKLSRKARTPTFGGETPSCGQGKSLLPAARTEEVAEEMKPLL